MMTEGDDCVDICYGCTDDGGVMIALTLRMGD